MSHNGSNNNQFQPPSSYWEDTYLDEGFATAHHHGAYPSPTHVDDWLDENAPPPGGPYYSYVESQLSNLQQQDDFQTQNSTMFAPGPFLPTAGFSGHSYSMNSYSIYPEVPLNYMQPDGSAPVAPIMATTGLAHQIEYAPAFPVMTMAEMPPQFLLGSSEPAGPAEPPGLPGPPGPVAESGDTQIKLDSRPKTASHIPVAPKGTKFLWKDNTHIDRTPFKAGVVEKSKLRFFLKDTQGRFWPYKYAHRHGFDWTDRESLAKAKKWRKQVFKRRVEKTSDDSDAGPALDTTKCKWSQREKTSIEVRVEEMIREKKRRLGMQDWAEITRAHNEQFNGVVIQVGELMPASRSIAGKDIAQRVNKTKYTVQSRSVEAVYSQANRWPEVNAMMAKEYAKLGYETTDEEGDPEMEFGRDGPESVMGSMVEHSGTQEHGMVQSLGETSKDTATNTLRGHNDGFEYTHTHVGVLATRSPMKTPSVYNSVGQFANNPTPLNYAGNAADEAFETKVTEYMGPIAEDSTSDNDADISTNV